MIPVKLYLEYYTKDISCSPLRAGAAATDNPHFYESESGGLFPVVTEDGELMDELEFVSQFDVCTVLNWIESFEFWFCQGDVTQV